MHLQELKRLLVLQLQLVSVPDQGHQAQVVRLLVLMLVPIARVQLLLAPPRLARRMLQLVLVLMLMRLQEPVQMVPELVSMLVWVLKVLHLELEPEAVQPVTMQSAQEWTTTPSVRVWAMAHHRLSLAIPALQTRPCSLFRLSSLLLWVL